MAEFLTTEDISARLPRLIKEAEERLFLVSPFLKINRRIKHLLEETNRFKKDVDVRVIYGKNELQPEENNWLESMTSIRTSFCKDLHAKCYLNEKEAILTSMNLYEYSQVNNYEMGIVVSQEDDPELYGKIYDEARAILRASEEIRVTVSRVAPAEFEEEKPERKESRRQSPAAPKAPTTGFCIRCKTSIPSDPEKPYCNGCFRSWNRYKNPEYEDEHCHICGGENPSTMLKPLCADCYLTYKDIFTFAAA